MTTRDTTVAVFRPDDGRLAAAAELVESLGATPVADPMLEVTATGATPRTDADVVVFTSKTGVDLAADAGFDAGDAVVAAVGDTTAGRLRDRGYAVDVVPAEFTSSGLVAALEDRVDGARVEVARSDHGSPVLLDGLEAAGAFVHETVLYELERPDGSGESAALAATGDLDAACFTSTLTVEHFLDAAAERGVREDAIAGLNDAVVGVIGPPTRETAESHGIAVDAVPDVADFDALATETVEAAAPTYHE
ncbi:uroporphyrinogen-III synthase [Halorubellus sp. JP-L1]|uniref:uroporphyrinogen-III synthase n=1 Tax=Halorubellus sp. JP-L1 TaxID=2715753 RepID=UPI00140DA9ED|nr:uroporphyrinogen-III synthase [Halorubellus sp. JP-L1]NHN43609.1 uroporphyrinogen-III synthase [Halorubellus sp. JP-L1]